MGTRGQRWKLLTKDTSTVIKTWGQNLNQAETDVPNKDLFRFFSLFSFWTLHFRHLFFSQIQCPHWRQYTEPRRIKVSNWEATLFLLTSTQLLSSIKKSCSLENSLWRLFIWYGFPSEPLFKEQRSRNKNLKFSFSNIPWLRSNIFVCFLMKIRNCPVERVSGCFIQKCNPCDRHPAVCFKDSGQKWHCISGWNG